MTLLLLMSGCFQTWSAEDSCELQTFYADADGDGDGNPERPREECEQPEGFVTTSGDCDDGVPQVNSLAEDICGDGIDQDCSGVADDGPGTAWFQDGDSDGYGSDATETSACDSPGAGWVDQGGDCDDADSAVNPGADEYCDSVDSNCDGSPTADAVDGETWYADNDDDGYGDPDDTIVDCSLLDGYADPSAGEDCDDSDELVNPGATEVCNDGIDNDCDEGPGDCQYGVGTSSWGGDGVFVGEDSPSYLGYTIANAGDYTGDGRPDLVVAAPYDTPGSYTYGGSVFVLNDFSGWEYAADAGSRMTPTSTYQYLGYTVLAGGDATGDGNNDLFFDARGSGDAYLLAGPFTGDTSTSVYKAFFDNFYPQDADMLDMNGDGTDDLVVGYTSGSSNGSMLIFQGPVGGDLTTSDAEAVIQGDSGEYLGYQTVQLDIDGDGVQDVGGATSTGTGPVYLFQTPMPSSTMSTSNADAWITTDATSGEFAAALEAADIDGDGYDDLLIGNPSIDEYGAAYVMRGPFEDERGVGGAWLRLRGGGNYGDFAQELDAGDLDGDGALDVAVGERYADPDSLSNAGTVWIFYAPESGTVTASEAGGSFLGEESGDYLGYSVRFLGDVDSDGYDDLAMGHIGAYDNAGLVSFFYGSGI